MKKILFFCVLPILVLVFLFHYWLVEQAVYGDSRYYWYLTRSVLIDHDLKLADEANHHYDHLGNNYQNENSKIPPEIPKDEFHLPIGTSIAWMPAFVFADFFARTLVFFRVPILANGYSDIYQITVGTGAVLFIVFGLYLSYKLARNFFSPWISGVTTLVMLFATNLFYYGSLDAVNSHAVSFFSSSIFFFVWYKTIKKRTFFVWFALGLLVGFLTETRTQDSVFISIIIMELLWKSVSFIRKNNKKKLIFILRSIRLLAIFFVGFLICMLPQILIWKIIFGGFFNVPYLAQREPFNILSPHVIGVLINYKTGIIPYSPIIIPAIFGLFIFGKKEKMLASIFLIFFGLEYFIISSWGAWDQASSYGIRMLLSSMPILILGAGTLIEKLLKFWSQKVVISICILFVLFNFFMIGVFHLFFKEVTYDQGFPTRVKAVEKLNKALHIKLRLFQ